MKIIATALILLMISPLVALSQSNYKAGFVIKNNGDTLKGYIYYKEWDESPKSVQFKKNRPDNEPTTFNAPALKGFHINDIDSYISYIGPVSTGLTHTDELPHYLDSAVRQDTVFLKIVSAGANVTLLYHADKAKYRYFILEAGAKTPYELNFYQYLDEDDKFISKTPFLDQLDRLLKKYAGSNINVVGKPAHEIYREDVLMRYVKIINNNKTTEQSQTLEYGSSIRYFAGAAVAFNTGVFNGPAGIPINISPRGFNYAVNSTSISPYIDAGIDFITNPNIQRHFFRIEASLTTLSPTFTGPVASFSSTQIVGTITPQVFYNVYNTEKLKFFVGVGVGITIKAITDGKLTATQNGVVLTPYDLQNQGASPAGLKAGQTISSPYNLPTTGANFKIKAGVSLNKKMEFYVAGVPYATEGASVDFSYKNLYTAVGFNYFFQSK